MKTYLALAWKLLPWVLAAIFFTNWWFRPQPGSDAAGPQVVIASEAALTKPARRHWKKHPVATCKPGIPGKPDFKLIEREPTPEEWERIARDYGLSHPAPQPVVVQPGQKIEPDSSGVLLAQPLTHLFGEYAAPEMRYGGTFVAGLEESGEFQARFKLNGTPRFRWTNVWGAGATVGVTPGLAPEDFTPKGAYAFWEPAQIKQIHLRLSPGYFESTPGHWGFRLMASLEWRAEPWRRKAGKGLVALPK